MSRGSRLWLALAGGLLAAQVSAAQSASPPPPATDAGPRPAYLPYAEFTPQEAPRTVTLKQAYNEVVRLYNESLFEYHTVLARHDALVERYNRTVDAAERRRVRDEAVALRGRLATLRRDVEHRATLVDEAARRAAAGGARLTR